MVDKIILESFIKEMYPCSFCDTEGLFMASAIRRKYMTAEEAKRLNLNNEASMIRKRFIRSNSMERIESSIKELLDADTILTKNDLHPRLETMVVYIMTGTSSTVKAYQGLKQRLTEIDNEMLSLAMTKSSNKAHPFHAMSRIDAIWYAELQKVAKSDWVDIDIDLNVADADSRAFLKDTIDSVFEGHDVRTIQVNTHGGVHLLMHKHQARYGKEFNPNSVCKKLNELLGEITSEVKILDSHMLPCPGTYQATHLVTFNVKIYGSV